MWTQILRHFPSTKPVEQAAALTLYAYTGLIPSNQDDQRGGGGYDGAVDVLLTNPHTGRQQIMEVTSSLDPTYQRSSDALREFERIIAQAYSGEASWSLGLERGWEFRRLKELAILVARALNDLDSSEAGTDQSVKVHPNVTTRWLGPTDPPIVYVDSRNAGASSFGEPYLDALAAYLASESTIANKLTKLKREGENLNATRRHFFIGMASTGKLGGLPPSSPSYFTWGDFTAPSILDDLWLHGDTGEIYHWSHEIGWVFHRMN